MVLLIFNRHAMLTTAKRPDIDTMSFIHVSIAINKKEIPNTIITFILFRTQCLCAYAVSKNKLSRYPVMPPSTMPNKMETGMLTKSIRCAFPPWAILENVENSTMTKISSQEAPARISCGIPFILYRNSRYHLADHRGTTIAGDTAARTAPMTAASIGLIPKI